MAVLVRTSIRRRIWGVSYVGLTLDLALQRNVALKLAYT